MPPRNSMRDIIGLSVIIFLYLLMWVFTYPIHLLSITLVYVWKPLGVAIMNYREQFDYEIIYYMHKVASWMGVDKH